MKSDKKASDRSSKKGDKGSKKQKKFQDTVKTNFSQQPLKWYNEQETKGNIKNALLKGGVEIATSAIGGSYIGALLGKNAPLIGSALIVLGHYTGDQTGLLRILGASVLANGIAKAKENHSQQAKSMSERLSEVKDELLIAFLLKRTQAKEGKKESNPQENKEAQETTNVQQETQIQNDPMNFSPKEWDSLIESIEKQERERKTS